MYIPTLSRNHFYFSVEKPVSILEYLSVSKAAHRGNTDFISSIFWITKSKENKQKTLKVNKTLSNL